MIRVIDSDQNEILEVSPSRDAHWEWQQNICAILSSRRHWLIVSKLSYTVTRSDSKSALRHISSIGQEPFSERLPPSTDGA
jgi:hypothetical protein